MITLKLCVIETIHICNVAKVFETSSVHISTVLSLSICWSQREKSKEREIKFEGLLCNQVVSCSWLYRVNVTQVLQGWYLKLAVFCKWLLEGHASSSREGAFILDSKVPSSSSWTKKFASWAYCGKFFRKVAQSFEIYAQRPPTYYTNPTDSKLLLSRALFPIHTS